MNYRLAISAFPRDVAADRILQAISESTGYGIDVLRERLEASPSWLLELPDRAEAEAWMTLLTRQRGVRALIVPSVGRPVESLESALPRARLALGDRSAAAAPAPAASGQRGITAPVGLSDDPELVTSGRVDAADAGRGWAGQSPSRGITAPVHFVDDGPGPGMRGTPKAVRSTSYDDHRTAEKPVVQVPLSDMVNEGARGGRRPLGDDLELDDRRSARTAAPTVAPAGLHRRAIKVKASAFERYVLPFLRITVPFALIGAAVFAWRHFDQPVVNKPDGTGVELIDAGRPPLAPLRLAAEEEEFFNAALSIQHRFATRQVEARPRIATIGGAGKLVREGGDDDYIDVKPSGRENDLGPLTLRPVRVLDRGITGPLPSPFIPDVSDDDRPSMTAFARMIQPPFVLFPAEPIGTGAQWRYRFDADANPLDLDLVVDVELLGRNGDQVTLGVKMTVPSTRDPGEAQGSTQRLGPFQTRFDPPVRIFDFAGVGEGRATLDLRRMTPVKLDVAIQFAARIEADTDFGRQTIPYSPVITLKLESE